MRVLSTFDVGADQAIEITEGSNSFKTLHHSPINPADPNR
jgi:hypothetical protein